MKKKDLNDLICAVHNLGECRERIKTYPFRFLKTKDGGYRISSTKTELEEARVLAQKLFDNFLLTHEEKKDRI